MLHNHIPGLQMCMGVIFVAMVLTVIVELSVGMCVFGFHDDHMDQSSRHTDAWESLCCL